MAEPDFDQSKVHRYFSADCFNKTWELIEKPQRTPDENEAYDSFEPGVTLALDPAVGLLSDEHGDRVPGSWPGFMPLPAAWKRQDTTVSCA